MENQQQIQSRIPFSQLHSKSHGNRGHDTKEQNGPRRRDSGPQNMTTAFPSLLVVLLFLPCASSSFTWHLGSLGQSCDATCAAAPGAVACDDAVLKATNTDAKILAAAAAVGVTCTQTTPWAYDHSPVICTASTCCAGACVGACSRGTSTHADACSVRVCGTCACVRYVCACVVRVRVWYVCVCSVRVRVCGTCVGYVCVCSVRVCACVQYVRVYASLPYRTGPYRRAHMLTLLLLPIVDHAAPYTC